VLGVTLTDNKRRRQTSGPVCTVSIHHSLVFLQYSANKGVPKVFTAVQCYKF
jgi:hypothetical protein